MTWNISHVRRRNSSGPKANILSRYKLAPEGFVVQAQRATKTNFAKIKPKKTPSMQNTKPLWVVTRYPNILTRMLLQTIRIPNCNVLMPNKLLLVLQWPTLTSPLPPSSSHSSANFANASPISNQAKESTDHRCQLRQPKNKEQQGSVAIELSDEATKTT